jgi:hypothetical protein
VRLSVPGQDGSDVGHEAQRVQDGEQVQQRGVGRVVEPRPDWYRVVCRVEKNAIFEVF